MEDLRRKRKAAHPLLILIQRGSFQARKSEFLRQQSKDGNYVASPTDDSIPHICDHPECSAEMLCQVSPSAVAADAFFNSSWPNSCSPSASEKCFSWLDKVAALGRMSNCSSHMSPSTLDRRPSLSRYSSSYTSWTRPVVGQENTDSCDPASNILDNDDNEEVDVALDLSKHRRKSSADTCKDIEDIEDFEFDFSDCDITDENELFRDDDSVKEGKDDTG